ncbi:MAG: YdcF family protein [Paludibacterium sp.]|uniref:YdcF family protein n=1 Tax=Paludibacterium sp. TaxID=1917523 RepID=UPI0025D2D676|nr:YdcF family protein [Paludibacterium sp.]MBV8046610.1 YdcF family protein [Paludibacterium sp.]MBV8648025.1 YdcF family protein [Paludibacterium sp.]
MHYLWLVLKGVLLAFLLVLMAMGGVAWSIVSYGEPPDYPANADAALVLGAAAWGDKPSPVFRERIRHAVELYKTGQVHWIVFTGGTPVPGYPSEADVGRDYALKAGVPMTAMLAEPDSRTTWENLQNAKKLAEPFGIHTYLLVSDPWHMRRAVLMARDLGLAASPSPTRSTRYRTLSARVAFLSRETWLYVGYRIFRMVS